MKTKKILVKIFIVALTIVVNHIKAADAQGMTLSIARQAVTTYRQQIASFSDLDGASTVNLPLARQTVTAYRQRIAGLAGVGSLDQETITYTGCFTASGLAAGDAEKAAAYDTYFNLRKVAAIRDFSTFMQEFANGQLLHDDVPVSGDSQPLDRSRAEFIAFGTRVITALTVVGSLAEDRFTKVTALPANNSADERTRFTEELDTYIRNALGAAINALQGPKSFFASDEDATRVIPSAAYRRVAKTYFIKALVAAMQ